MEKSIILNQNCFGWDKDSNQFMLRRYEIYFNDVLRERGYVFLYEIYNVLGIKLKKNMLLSGWIRDKGHLEFEVFQENDGSLTIQLLNLQEDISDYFEEDQPTKAFPFIFSVRRLQEIMLNLYREKSRVGILVKCFTRKLQAL